MEVNIPLSNPDITPAERRAVLEVLKSPNLSLGPRLPEFERLGAQAAGCKYAVAVNSGTSGLHLILRSLGIGRGDKVITTPFSFIASANCMLFENAVPLFADIDPKTLCISPDSVRAILRRSRSKKIKAILAVDVFGHPADWDQLYDIAEEHGLLLIEDSCEALGAAYRSPDSAGPKRWHRSKKAGSFGSAGVFAFYPNKQITTGEGGLIVTNDRKIARLCRSMRNQGRAEDQAWLNHVRLGFNYRISDINCALGIAQINRLGDILKKRQRVAQRYARELGSLSGIMLPWCAPHITMSWFVYVIRLKGSYTRKDRDAVIEGLRSCGIASSNYFAPIHLQPFYRKQLGYRRGDFPVTEFVADRTIALPFFNALKKAEISYIAEKLKAILGKQ